MREKIFMGIDGGGTYTRVVIVNAEGNILSHVKWKGGAFGRRNPNAKENVNQSWSNRYGNAGNGYCTG